MGFHLFSSTKLNHIIISSIQHLRRIDPPTPRAKFTPCADGSLLGSHPYIVADRTPSKRDQPNTPLERDQAVSDQNRYVSRLKRPKNISPALCDM